MTTVNEKPEKNYRAPIVPGLLMILIGLWLLGRQLDLPLFVGDVLWPWIIIVLGIIIWARFLAFPPRNADDVWWGTAALLSGVFLLTWRNGLLFGEDGQGGLLSIALRDGATGFEVGSWGTLWPVIPLIIGLSSLVKWPFAIRDWGSLVFGAGFTAAGLVGLAYTTGAISSATAWAYAQYWPLLVVLAGLGLLIQGILGPRTGR